jgi:hypothetical protein
MGSSSASGEREDRQVLALLTRSPGKGGRKRLDTFTIPMSGRKQRVVSTRYNHAPSLDICQLRAL